MGTFFFGRYGLVRVRENAESIAFYSGEAAEGRLLFERLGAVVENYVKLIRTSRNLEFFTSFYRCAHPAHAQVMCLRRRAREHISASVHCIQSTSCKNARGTKSCIHASSVHDVRLCRIAAALAVCLCHHTS